jgi:hypothetical protein
MPGTFRMSDMKTIILAAIAALSLNLGSAGAKTPDEQPGWTGRAFVPGSHSTIASDARATRLTQTGQYSG